MYGVWDVCLVCVCIYVWYVLCVMVYVCYVYGVCDVCLVCICYVYDYNGCVCVCVHTCVHRRATGTCRCQMDQLVKCLLSKYEELSFTTSPHVKKLNVGAREMAQQL